MDGKTDTVMVISADAHLTRIRVVNRLGAVVYCRDLGPLPESHRQFCDLLDQLPVRFSVNAVGHRFLNGPGLAGPAVVDDTLAVRLADPRGADPREVVPAAHGLTLARTHLAVPHVACPDSGFYAGLPKALTCYHLPAGWQTRYPLRRQGFHGLSHAYAVWRAGQLAAGNAATTRLISCHLGPTSSVTAVRDGRAVDTTLGFQPSDALIGETGGPLDAGALLHLVVDELVPAAAVRHLLSYQSGLHAIAGRRASFAELVAAADTGDGPARQAVEAYQHQIAAAIAGLTAGLGGLDLLVFTGPLGHPGSRVRADLARRLAHLGVALAPGLNARIAHPADLDGVISPAGNPVTVAVVRTREELQIATEIRRVLPGPARVVEPPATIDRPRPLQTVSA